MNFPFFHSKPAANRPAADTLSRYRGCLFGGAIGDALGYPVEFISENHIWNQYGEAGIQTLAQAGHGHPAHISDDTQMTLFAANGLLYGMSNPDGQTPLSQFVWQGYLEWLGTQGDSSRMDPAAPKMWIYGDDRLHRLRAPGNTCLSAISYSPNGWSMQAPGNNSLGCGTVMRAAPFGLAYPRSAGVEVPMRLSAEDAALTHGHHLAWACSAWLSACIYLIIQEPMEEAVPLEAYFSKIKPGDLDPDGEMQEQIDLAVRLAKDLSVSDLDGIHQLGEGWRGDEALAIAVFCAVRYQNDFAAALRAAVNHNGDSDSTGAICGNLLGAWLGWDAVASAFSLKDLELTDVLDSIAADLYRAVNLAVPISGEDAQWDERYRNAVACSL